MRNKMFGLVLIFLVIVFLIGCSDVAQIVEESTEDRPSEEKEVTNGDTQEEEIEEVNNAPTAIIDCDKTVGGKSEKKAE